MKQSASLKLITSSSLLLAAVLAVAALMAPATTASADVTSPCIADGYLTMNTVFYGDIDYMLVGTYGGMFAGYGYLKFDSLPSELVASATVQLTSIAQTSGMFTPVEDEPASLSAIAATADVAGINGSNAADYLQNMGDVIDTITVSGGDGVCTLDITSLVNQWITTGVNNGLFISTSSSDMGFAKFHTSETLTDGAAPVLVSVVPEPASMLLLAAGAAGAIARRRRG